MKKILLAAGMVAVSCAAPSGADAKSCPPGQILRVSSGECQPKSSQNAQWLKPGSGKPAAKPSAATPEVGDVVLFGSTPPSAKAAPKKEAKAKPATAQPVKPAHDKTQNTHKTVATHTAPPVPAHNEARDVVGAIPQPRIADTKAEEPRPVEVTQPEPAPAPTSAPPQQVVEAPEQPAPVAQPDEAERVSSAVASTAPEATVVPEEGDKTPPADEAPAIPEPAPQIAALGKDSDSRLDHDAPSQAEAQPPAADKPGEQSQPASNLPDWGDEKRLVEALRANWTSKPVAREFHRGDEVPADVPLQPLPQPYASRDTGVNMHYLIANGDAVLVLPGMRVVVDVFNGSTASLAGR